LPPSPRMWSPSLRNSPSRDSNLLSQFLLKMKKKKKIYIYLFLSF
jgi:hypothetical protein